MSQNNGIFEDFRNANPNLNLTDEEITLITSVRELSDADYEAFLCYIRSIQVDKGMIKG